MNEITIRQWYDTFKSGEELVEVRIVDNAYKRTYSGYFTDVDTLLNEIRKYDNCNIYFTLNAINPACYDREQHDRIVTKPKSTTSDNDIVGRDWILIDIDTKKPSDTNSTDEEKEMAKEVVNNVFKFLRDEGFEKPVVCDSGNGFHLLYKIAMKNSNENTTICKEFLQVLDMLFSNSNVEIDCTTHNASRVCKLYGTFSRKGSNTKKRPQRESKILRIPDEVKITPNEYFAKVAAMLPKPEQPSKSNYYSNEKFDLEAFLNKHHISVRNIVRTSSFTKYILDECPFNSSHRAPDSAIFEMSNGGLGFKCLHSSCSQYTWKDFRLKFEPDAYDHKEYQRHEHKMQYYSQQKKEPFVPKKEDSTKGKKWLAMTDVQYVDMSKMASIPTGYKELDKKIIGLLLGDVTVLSGGSGAGKSSWIDCVALNAIQRGYKVGIWSGELQDFRFQSWINQIAAGKNYVCKREGFENYYYAPKNISNQISNWLEGKLFLYNNNYGSKWQQLFADVKELVDKEGVQLIVLDNLMALQIDNYEGDKYTQQTKFINDLKEYAKAKNVHVLLVCHPRKEGIFLRKESISGTADLTNLADSVFIIHRIGKDFEQRAGEFFGKDKVTPYLKYNSVIEVCKNRSMGVIDLLVGMYYEVESRRLKNEISENIVYGWQEQPAQLTFEPTPESDVSDLQDIYDNMSNQLPFGNELQELPF
ncbi:DNA directed DNA polymerase [Bacteroides phage C3_41T2LP]|nr:DNA directed DNA polymerase [Bacteroides phage C3_41T2LP]